MKKHNASSLSEAVIFTEGSNLYYRISNPDGKIWYIPDSNSRPALQLYQPGSFKGKLLKHGFLLIKIFPFIRNFLQISLHKYSPDPSLQYLLSKFFKIDNPEISIFFGTPSVHQKTVMQVSDRKEMLGYCKLSDNEDVKALFRHEESILKELRDRSIRNAPECLSNGKWKDEFNLFIQTTIKTSGSKYIHKLKDIHWEFLQKLYNKTKTTLPFSNTDFFRLLQLLRMNLDFLPESDMSIVSSCIEKVEEFYKQQEVEFSFYQGDFTPWNMFVEKNALFVFDWEYSKRTYPPFLDAFHFFTQTLILEEQKEFAEIIKVYYSKRKIMSRYFDNIDLNYCCYLLGVISDYVEREKKQISENISKAISIWVRLLERLL